MPRFVLLHHEMPDADSRVTHWDLMLEHDGQLHTWALPKRLVALDVLEVERLADHRLHYLDYEGPVSGERGTVTQVDSGEFEFEERGEDVVVARLSGKEGECRIQLEQLANGPRWLLTMSPI